METTDNKPNVNIWIGAAAIIILALVFWMTTRGGDEVVPEDENAVIVEEEIVSEEDVSERSVNAPATPTAPVVTLSYQEALAQYADARIQIDSTCQVSPNNVTYKDGTSIMLDNRSSVSRTIGGLGSTFSIKAYGFKIVKLSSNTLPATLLMNCDGSQNVATILIQK